jgi:hypothetical protein
MSTQPFTDKIREADPQLFERFVRTCERTRRMPLWSWRPLTEEERERVEAVTSFEMLNFNGRRRVLKLKGSRMG